VHRLDADTHQRALAAALGELRVEDREILLLHAWAELNDGEIAEALSLPICTVKSRLHRTRERKRNQLAASGQSNNEPSSNRREARMNDHDLQPLIDFRREIREPDAETARHIYRRATQDAARDRGIHGQRNWTRRPGLLLATGAVALGIAGAAGAITYHYLDSSSPA
jgi:hypothetical protein